MKNKELTTTEVSPGSAITTQVQKKQVEERVAIGANVVYEAIRHEGDEELKRPKASQCDSISLPKNFVLPTTVVRVGAQQLPELCSGWFQHPAQVLTKDVPKSAGQRLYAHRIAYQLPRIILPSDKQRRRVRCHYFRLRCCAL